MGQSEDRAKDEWTLLPAHAFPVRRVLRPQLLRVFQRSQFPVRTPPAPSTPLRVTEASRSVATATRMLIALCIVLMSEREVICGLEEVMMTLIVIYCSVYYCFYCAVGCLITGLSLDEGTFIICARSCWSVRVKLKIDFSEMILAPLGEVLDSGSGFQTRDLCLQQLLWFPLRIYSSKFSMNMEMIKLYYPQCGNVPLVSP